jgi:uncharacterized protein (TIGR02266 family)
VRASSSADEETTMTDAIENETRGATSGTRCAAWLEITIDHHSEHAFWADLAMQAERGGVFYATYHQFSLGTLLNFVVTLPDGERPIPVKGVVRWTRPHLPGSDGAVGVGVKFIELAAEAKERIERFARTVREPMVFELDEVPVRRKRKA